MKMKKRTEKKVRNGLLRALLLFLPWLFCLNLTGCSDTGGKAPGRAAVLREVDAVCPEPYKLVSKEKIAGYETFFSGGASNGCSCEEKQRRQEHGEAGA